MGRFGWHLARPTGPRADVGLESWLGLRGLVRADTFVFASPRLASIQAYEVPQWSLGAGLGLSLALP